MFYNRILRVWVIDVYDYFLLSVLFGTILASCLKDYLSEKKSMKRLKQSIIEKSLSGSKSDKLNINSKKIRIEKIYRLAIENRGGQFDSFHQIDDDISIEAFKLADEIKKLVERLALYLKQKELKGIARVFFRNGRLLLELILYKCKVDITYSILSEQLNSQFVIITVTTGGIAGFTVSWFSVGASLIAPPLLISILLIRSVGQQIVNQRDYSKFQKLVNKMLEDEKLKQTLQAFFVQGEPPSTSGLKMKTLDLDKNPLLDYNFDSDQTFDDFIKNKMKEKLGLIEDPTSKQIEEIIQHRKIKNKGKVVYYKDFINPIAENSDNIIDAEIIKENIKVKVKNEEF